MYVYRIAGKFGEFGESSVIRQTKTIQIFTYNYYLMAESIHSPNFASPNAHNSEIRQTFPLYGINELHLRILHYTIHMYLFISFNFKCIISSSL